jgi:hypothetical protein
MPILNVVCPNKHRPFSTGLEITAEKKDSLPNRITFSQCPFCKTVHGWTPNTAFFGDGKTAMRRPAAACSRGARVRGDKQVNNGG